jgi:hypothetical protein
MASLLSESGKTDQNNTDSVKTEEKVTDIKETTDTVLNEDQKKGEEKSNLDKLYSPDGEDGNSDEKADGDSDEEKKEEPEKKAPESYEIEYPEGIEIDKDLEKGFLDIAREIDLSNEDAQKVAAHYAKFAEGAVAKQEAEFAKEQEKWTEQIKADPKYQENIAFAKRAVEEFADEDTQSLMKDSWLGNHPGVVDFLNKVGRAISEDPVHEGKDTGPKEKKSPQDLFYN